MRRLAVLGATLAALVVPATAVAQDCPQTSLGDVEDEVMCPACGVPLELATDAPQAQREREFIEQLIAECKSKDEVKTALSAEFGDEVLATPDDEGIDLAAWLVPGLAILGALVAVFLGVRRWRRGRPSPAVASEPAPGGDAAARLDADIRSYDL